VFFGSFASALGWRSELQGDARTVGRGGAGIVLSDNLWGVFENPAGSALTAPGTTLQLARNSIIDQELAGSALNNELVVKSGGIVIPETPWGFAFGSSESNQTIPVREYHLSASRLFLEDHLSLGVAMNYGISFTEDKTSSTSTSWGTTLGALYRFPKRILIGVSFRSGMNYASTDGVPFSHPWSLGMSVGHIPNRFFRGEAGVRWLGANYSDQSVPHPKPYLGLEYKFLDLRLLQARLFTGGYYEDRRMHSTFGINLDPWVFALGAAVDLARNYRNYLFSVGLDIGRTLKRFKLIPPTVPGPPGGLFPRSFEILDDWLPPRLQDDPENSFQEIGASIRRITNHVGNLEEIIEHQPTVIEDEADALKKDWNDLKNSIR
jgi:hypothetical protein